jgi:hypothetical protein
VRISQDVLWWDDDFVPRDFSANGRLTFYPRVYGKLCIGLSGDILVRINPMIRVWPSLVSSASPRNFEVSVEFPSLDIGGDILVKNFTKYRIAANRNMGII